MVFKLKLGSLPALPLHRPTWSKTSAEFIATRTSMVPSHIAARLWTVLFFATAATTGMIAQYMLFGSFSSEAGHVVSSTGIFNVPAEPFIDNCGSSKVSQYYTRPALGHAVFPVEDQWTIPRIKEMVARTRGYSVRDWPLTLGWNNLRYIIESAVLHAQMLNRTLVIPSFYYARSCEFAQPVCASFTQQFRRGDEIGMGDFGYLSEEQQQAWRIPMHLMIDMARLRQAHPVVTVTEYLHLHDLPLSYERGDGHWDREKYIVPDTSNSMYVFSQTTYEPSGVVRVDRAPYQPLRSHAFENEPIFLALKEELQEAKAIDLDRVQSLLRNNKLAEWDTDAEFDMILRDNGWTIVYTFKGVWMEMLKTVTEPIAQVAMMSQVRGLLDEYEGVNSDVLLTEGEIHSNMKPGSLRFHTASARTQYASLVMTGVRPIAPIRELAERLARKMQRLNHGRQFMSAHMRRGDFVVFSWAPENSVEGHIARVKARLARGLKFLHKLANEPPRSIDVPGVTPDTFFAGAPLPLPDDKFFVATDERDPAGLAYMRSQGAVFIGDLITPEERRIVGWPILLTDVLSQVEQLIASHGVFFSGHSMSSVAGGIANYRGARGFDPRTSVFD